MNLAARIARFWSKVDRSSGPGGCWPWLGTVDKDGYGQVTHRRTSLLGEIRAHRIAWVLEFGPIPRGKSVLHHCDTPACTNARRCCFLGTPAENMYDRHAKGRYATGHKHHWHSSRYTHLRGEEHPAAKLTDSEVEEIRAQFVDRYGEQTRLARKYGVSVDIIHLIVRRKVRQPVARRRA